MRSIPLSLEPSKFRSYSPGKCSPRVVPIYWDEHFRDHRDEVTVFDEFLRALFQSSWMTDLARHGVARARALPSFVPPRALPARVDPSALRAQLTTWVETGAVAPPLLGPGHPHFFLILGRSLAGTVPDDERCLFVSFTERGNATLEAMSRPICEALSDAFRGAAAPHRKARARGVALERTSSVTRSLLARR
jgi:hypothetical protein